MQITGYQSLSSYTDNYVISAYYEIFPDDNGMKKDYLEDHYQQKKIKVQEEIDISDKKMKCYKKVYCDDKKMKYYKKTMMMP
jgi:hypothetical protein